MTNQPYLNLNIFSSILNESKNYELRVTITELLNFYINREYLLVTSFSYFNNFDQNNKLIFYQKVK